MRHSLWDTEQKVPQHLAACCEFSGSKVNGNDVYLKLHYKKLSTVSKDGVYGKVESCWYKTTYTEKKEYPGYYCGGHLKLKTRGLVYGFTKHQSLLDEDIKDNLDYNRARNDQTPKVPVNPDIYNQSDINASPYEFHIMSTSNHQKKYCLWDHVFYDDGGAETLLTGSGSKAIVTYLLKEDGEITGGYHDGILTDAAKNAYTAKGGGDLAEPVSEAKDLFSIDQFSIKRAKEAIPDYTLNYWNGWNADNMSMACGIAAQDYSERYGLPDVTNNIVGNASIGSSGDRTLALDANQQAYILGSLMERFKDYYPSLTATKDFPTLLNEATAHMKKDGWSALSPDEQDVIRYNDRLRHIQSAMNCIGTMNYSQKHHSDKAKSFHINQVTGGWAKMKEWSGNPGFEWTHSNDIRGMLSDCSGFVSNIWYDRKWQSSGPATHPDAALDAANNIYTTAAFRGMAASHHVAATSYPAGVTDAQLRNHLPGDILVTNKHALLYIGRLNSNVIANIKGSHPVSDSYGLEWSQGAWDQSFGGYLEHYAIDCTEITNGTGEISSGVVELKKLDSDDYSGTKGVVCIINPEKCALTGDATPKTDTGAVDDKTFSKYLVTE